MTRQNRDGSYQTQRDRRQMLLLIARQLYALGYKQLRAHEIKPRHDQKLVALWKAQGVKADTIRNRLAVLRWWAVHVDRAWVLPKTNTVYGLAPRQTVT